MMNQLHVGFGRVNITPAMGTPIGGYYVVRLADHVKDELEANAVAFSLGDTKALLISADISGLFYEFAEPLCQQISKATGVPAEHIFITCTHTHTGPEVNLNRKILPEKQEAYFPFFCSRLTDAAMFALQDLKPAKMGFGVGQAPGIAFVRRYRMKDGSTRTNPGINNPDVVAPIGDVDERVGVLRFDREGGETIVLCNIGIHPDTVGGCGISGDWPAFTRRIFEKTVENTRCVMLNGAQGDVNHVNTSPAPGQNNDLTMDFDDCMRGYGHAKHMGMTVAGAVMQVFSKVAYVPVDSLTAMKRILVHPSNMPTPEELPEAHRINNLHQAGKDAELPWEGMMLTTIVAEAERMVQLEHGPEKFDLCMGALAIGNVALMGVPGEPFTAVGRTLKEAPGWDLVMPMCCTNGYEGYFPTIDAYLEGGYEARSSIFKAGVAEAVADTGRAMLDQIRNSKGE